MKVVHVVIGKANPATTMNGVNVAVDAYARALHRAGLEIEVWGIAGNPRTNLPRPEYPIRFFRHHHGWPARLDPALVACLGEVDRPGTVFHLYGGFLPTLAALARRLRSPYFVMPQGIYSEVCLRRRWGLKWLYFHLAEKRMLRRSRGLLLVQEGELSPRLARSLAQVPRHVVPNGADRPRGVPALRPAWPEKRPTVWGYCGRILNAQKGVDQLVRCFLAFRRERPSEEHVLSLVGDGPDLAAIRRRHSAACGEGLIEIHGSLFGEAKLAHLARMDYFVHLSRWEGIPTACLEAAALGIPLLVTPGTNLADDVVRFRAGIAAEGDDAAVVRAMHRLALADRRALAAGCKRLVDEKYNWQKSSQRLIQVYREALRP